MERTRKQRNRSTNGDVGDEADDDDDGYAAALLHCCTAELLLLLHTKMF